MAKQSNDSTQTIKGIIYQFLVALDRCFELQEGQSVYIETHGDVSVLKDESEQIESKFYNGYLTELDHNIWKTINNWMKDGFALDRFASLVLLTTQKVRINSPWYSWNKKKKEEKLEIVLKIYNKYSNKNTQSKETKDFLDFIFDDSKRKRLINVLDKFFIEHNAIDDKEYYNLIKKKNTTHLRPIRADQYMRTMFGYILSPEVIDKSWEISYENFSLEAQNITIELVETTKVFPDKIKLDNIKYDEYLNNPFVEKIKEINYDKVLTEAITDFAETRELILSEFRLSPTVSKSLKNYGENIKKKHRTKYRQASRNCSSETKIADSQDFYDDVTGMNSGTFHVFNSVPQDFYTGVIHMLADEEVEFVWLLNND